MPEAFEIKNVTPHLNVPEELRYEYMTHRLAKIFGVSPPVAEQMSEKDFWMAVVFENLDYLRREEERKTNPLSG